MMAGLACSVIGLGSATLLDQPTKGTQRHLEALRVSPGGANVQGAGSCLIGLATPQMTHPNNRPIPSQI